MKTIPAIINHYLQEQAFTNPGEELLPRPLPHLKLSVVIPSLAERENLGSVLDSLFPGNQRLDEAEVLVLVNNGIQPEPAILENNLGTLADLKERAGGPLRIFSIDRVSPQNWLPEERKGVGWVRRLGMDLAFKRLVQAGNFSRSAIACLDADSPVAPGYLDAVLATFDQEQPPPAGVCDYAHSIPEDPRLAKAIIAYELWLRYFELGLKVAGSPFAFQTLGSCMVVSPLAYARVKGMKPRQAAEDFHFLSKLAKLNRGQPLLKLTTARVFPMARVSRRVPFGTGRAMQRALAEGADDYLQVAPPEIFLELKVFFAALPRSFEQLDNLPKKTSSRLWQFLVSAGAEQVLEKLQHTYPDAKQFTRAVHHWFDSLKIVRYVNQRVLEDGRVWLFDALGVLLKDLGLDRNYQDLPRPRVKDINFEIALAWLQRLRAF